MTATRKGLAGAAKVSRRPTTFPYLAHAPHGAQRLRHPPHSDGGVEMMFGSQLPDGRPGASRRNVLGLKPDAGHDQDLLAGGSFGRRATPAGDMAVEAAMCSRPRSTRAPIKVIWTREDDIKGGRYRPIFVHRLRAASTTSGKIVAWDQRIVGQSFM